jgi:hypothetical protein
VLTRFLVSQPLFLSKTIARAQPADDFLQRRTGESFMQMLCVWWTDEAASENRLATAAMGNQVSTIGEKMSNGQKDMMLGQREMMMASSVGRLRDDLMWLAAFHSTMATLLFIGAVKTGNPKLCVPYVPMSFSLAYMYDGAYGTKFDRVRANTEEILADPKQRKQFILPLGNRMMSPETYMHRILNAPDAK